MWLYDGLSDRLSQKAIDLIEAGRLVISPIAELELQYLHELVVCFNDFDRYSSVT
jgi:hypothetical protein